MTFADQIEERISPGLRKDIHAFVANHIVRLHDRLIGEDRIFGPETPPATLIENALLDLVATISAEALSAAPGRVKRVSP